MQLSSYHQAILDGVREDRESSKSDADILEAALVLLSKIVAQVDALDKAVNSGGLRSVVKTADVLTDLATEAYNLLGD